MENYKPKFCMEKGSGLYTQNDNVSMLVFAAFIRKASTKIYFVEAFLMKIKMTIKIKKLYTYAVSKREVYD